MNERTDAHARGPIFHRGNENEISLNSHYHIRLFRSIVDGVVSEIWAFCMTLVLCHATHTHVICFPWIHYCQWTFVCAEERRDGNTHTRTPTERENWNRIPLSLANIKRAEEHVSVSFPSLRFCLIGEKRNWNFWGGRDSFRKGLHGGNQRRRSGNELVQRYHCTLSQIGKGVGME